MKNRDPTIDCLGLPNEFKIGPPTEELNWAYNPEEREADVNELHQALIQLMDEGMTGDDLLRTFVSRRVNPLQSRTHKMCVMSGRHDPNRMSTFALSKAEIYRRVKAIAKTSMDDGEWQWGKEPYDRHHPGPAVSIRTFPSNQNFTYSIAFSNL